MRLEVDYAFMTNRRRGTYVFIVVSDISDEYGGVGTAYVNHWLFMGLAQKVFLPQRMLNACNP